MTLPPFAQWLADREAPRLEIEDGGVMLDWIGQAYGEKGVNDILAAIIEFHGDFGVSQVLHAEKNETIQGPWEVLDVYGKMSWGDPITITMAFRTTDAYL